jgi:hypothetical protein
MAVFGWCNNEVNLLAGKVTVGVRIAGGSGSITAVGLISRLKEAEVVAGTGTGTVIVIGIGIAIATGIEEAARTRWFPAPPMTCAVTTVRWTSEAVCSC